MQYLLVELLHAHPEHHHHYVGAHDDELAQLEHDVLTHGFREPGGHRRIWILGDDWRLYFEFRHIDHSGMNCQPGNALAL